MPWARQLLWSVGSWHAARRHHLAIIVLLVFVLLLLHFSVYQVLTSGEINTMLKAKQLLEPEFLERDWLISVKPRVRIPFEVALSPFVWALPLPAATVAARIMVLFLFALGLGLICRRLEIDALTACTIVGLFIFYDQAFEPQKEWMVKRLESRTGAYVFVLFALHSLMRRRLSASFAFAGLATTLHVLVGFWSTIALAMTALSRGWTVRGLVRAGVAWVTTASPAVYFSILHFSGQARDPTPSVDKLYVYYRNGSRLDPAKFDFEWRMILLAAMFAVVLLIGKRWLPRREDAAVVGAFGMFTTVPYVVGLLVWLTPYDTWYLKYYPFRVGSTVFLLAGLLLGVPLALRFVIRKRAVPWLLLILSGMFLWNAATRFATGWESLRNFPRGGEKISPETIATLYDACGWIRDNTSPDSMLLASPSRSEITLLCERAVPVRYRDDPPKAADFNEWYRRLQDFTGGMPLKDSGMFASRFIETRFHRLTTREYIDLGRKYGGDYLLLRKVKRLPPKLPLLYSNDGWAVYDLPQAVGSRASD